MMYMRVVEGAAEKLLEKTYSRSAKNRRRRSSRRTLRRAHLDGACCPSSTMNFSKSVHQKENVTTHLASNMAHMAQFLSRMKEVQNAHELMIQRQTGELVAEKEVQNAHELMIQRQTGELVAEKERHATEVALKRQNEPGSYSNQSHRIGLFATKNREFSKLGRTTFNGEGGPIAKDN